MKWGGMVDASAFLVPLLHFKGHGTAGSGRLFRTQDISGVQISNGPPNFLRFEFPKVHFLCKLLYGQND